MNTNGGDCLGYFLPATDDQANCVVAVEQYLAGTSLMMIVNQAGG